MVTNLQLYLALGVPVLLNAVLIGLLMAYINAKVDALGSKFEARFDVVDARFVAVYQRFDDIDRRFDHMEERFDDMRDLWRAELRRMLLASIFGPLRHFNSAHPK